MNDDEDMDESENRNSPPKDSIDIMVQPEAPSVDDENTRKQILPKAEDVLEMAATVDVVGDLKQAPEPDSFDNIEDMLSDENREVGATGSAALPAGVPAKGLNLEKKIFSNQPMLK